VIRKATFHVLEELDLPFPVELLATAVGRRRGAFVLDGTWGAPAGSPGCVLVGAEPFLSLRATRTGERSRAGRAIAHVVVADESGIVRADVDDPLAVLRALLAEHAVDTSVLVDRPLPFMGGAVGYVGYEVGQVLERLPNLPRTSSAPGMPDLAMFFHRWVLGTSRSAEKGKPKTWLSVIGRDALDAQRTRDGVMETIASFRPGSTDARRETSGDLEAQMTRARVRAQLGRAAYVDRVRTAKRHIEDGDAFEICLTNALDAPFAGDPWTLWNELRRTNPAPMSAWLDLREGAVVSASPERFVRLDEQRAAESRPIKGTRPRGTTAQEDARLAHDLASSEKDRAENSMIVDLVRNDLGKVCRFGSVTTPNLYEVEPHPNVHQLVSTVRGELNPERDAIDLLRACFPPGSMTGAPKIEAMSILESLEPKERGVYAGALGFFDFAGPMDLSVVIRSAVVSRGRASFSVGGAVVADSDPETEHDETLHKARGLVAVLAALARTDKQEQHVPLPIRS